MHIDALASGLTLSNITALRASMVPTIEAALNTSSQTTTTVVDVYECPQDSRCSKRIQPARMSEWVRSFVVGEANELLVGCRHGERTQHVVRSIRDFLEQYYGDEFVLGTNHKFNPLTPAKINTHKTFDDSETQENGEGNYDGTATRAPRLTSW